MNAEAFTQEERKKTFALIKAGTFLEYFDLYLYTHMAVVLNEVFLPKTDPHITILAADFIFSSAYLLRPLGALCFGYLGDCYGRRSTIILTTMLIALCSFIIGSLPPFSKIGFFAPMIMILCRMIQGICAVGGSMGARIYMIESSSPPRSYFDTTMVDFWGALGISFALIIGGLFLWIDPEEGWRLAFYFGAGIAMVGSLARTKLKETPEFLQERSEEPPGTKNLRKLLPDSSTFRNFLCYLGVECLRPLCFYLIYLYFGELLKTKYGLMPSDVIHHNLFVALLEASATWVYARMALKFHPLNIVKIRGIVFLCYVFFCRFCSIRQAVSCTFSLFNAALWFWN